MPYSQDRFQLGIIIVVAVVIVGGLLGPEQWRTWSTNIGLVGFLVLFWYRGITALPRTRALVFVAALYTAIALAYWGWMFVS